MSGKSENAVAMVAALAAVAVAKKAAGATWKMGAGKEPPSDPADPDVELREAMVWAVVSGVFVSVLRTAMARRLARPERRKARVAQAVSPAR